MKKYSSRFDRRYFSLKVAFRMNMDFCDSPFFFLEFISRFNGILCNRNISKSHQECIHSGFSFDYYKTSIKTWSSIRFTFNDTISHKWNFHSSFHPFSLPFISCSLWATRFMFDYLSFCIFFVILCSVLMFRTKSIFSCHVHCDLFNSVNGVIFLLL